MPLFGLELCGQQRRAVVSMPSVREDPIFILGAERSGTTLAMAMLGCHSQISVPEVTWFYPRYRRYLQTYGPLSDARNFHTLLEEMLFGLKRPFFGLSVNPHTVLREIMQFVDDHSFRGAFKAIMEWHRTRCGKVRWGEKTPHSLFYLTDIFEDFPNAKVILMYRDGRDVVCSQLRSCFGPTNAVAGALLWKRCARATIEAMHKYPAERLIAISYESMVTAAKDTLDQICHFLSEEYEPAMLAFYKGDLATQRARTIDHRSLGEPVHSRFIGVHKDEMARCDERTFCQIAGDELRELGYEVGVAGQRLDPDYVDRMVERDARTRAANLDAVGGHVVIESYADWVVDQRELRRQGGIWSGPAPPVPSMDDWPQEQIEGFRAPRAFKRRFAIPRRYAASEWVL